jgi:RND family efflux transporter MFP subunit
MKHTRSLRLSIFLSLMLAVSMAMTFERCSKKHADEDEQSQPSTPPVVAVKTTDIAEGTIDRTISATGKTDALRKERILSPIAGKILTFSVLEGTPVKTGDVIAVIQTKETLAAISGSEAILRSARTEQEKTDAQRALDLARSTESSVTVRAKFNGIVSTRAASEGELVAENAELCTMLDLSSIVFTADVALSDIPSIHLGQPSVVEFQSLPESRFTASVAAINPQTDVQSQTIAVRLRFAAASAMEKQPLKTDMAGTAHIIVGRQAKALLVPKTALLRNDEANTYSVVTVTPDSLAKSVMVSIGSATDSTIEIMSAELHKGMPIVTEGNYSLADSTKVTIAH